jgi:transcriptional regulator with XRE-family HTH domain
MNYVLKSIPRLSERLKYVRQMAHLTQAELAGMAGTTQQAIQQAETGKARQPRYLHRIARELGVPFEWLAFNEVPGSVKGPVKSGLSERENEVITGFRAMNRKEQNLILDIMKARGVKE